MQTTINPHRFIAQEMSLNPLARGQSAVVIGGLRVGRISHAISGEGKASWLWSLTGPSCTSMPADCVTCGAAAALADAKLQLRHAFDGWLHWALEQPGPVHWHWVEAPPEGRALKTPKPEPLAMTG